MHPPARARARFAQGRQKTLAIGVIAENRRPPVTTVEHMADGSGKFDADFASHAPMVCRSRPALSMEKRAEFTD